MNPHDLPRSAARVLLRLTAPAIALAIAFGTAAAEPSASIVLPDGSVLWGAYIPGAPFDPAVLNAFEARSGKKMSILHWGEPWVINGAAQPFQVKQFQAVRNRGTIP